MAEEVKRVSFTTLPATEFGNGAVGGFSAPAASQKPQSATAKSSSSAPGGAASQKKPKTSRPSFRMEVKLFEPDADSFPQYNFRQLLNAEKKKLKKRDKPSNGFPGADHFDDPLGGDGDDDDVARLAKEMEAKYGSGSSYSKATKRGAVDHFDKGAGYDENDSFIDNTEAYDELIPDEIEPNHGGFYINSGLLEFHHRPNYERPEDAQRMPKARKRTLSTSSEDEEDDKTAAGAKDKSKRQKSPQPVNGSGATAPTSSAELPTESHQKEKTTGQVEKRVKLDKDGKVKVKKTKVEKEATKQNPAVVSTIPADSEKSPKTTTVKDMLRLKRDNHRNKHDSTSPTATPNPQPIQSNKIISSSSSSSDSDSGSDVVATTTSSAQPQPPQSTHRTSTATATKGDAEQGKSSSRQNGLAAELPENVSMELMQNLIILEQSTHVLNGPGENILSNPAVLDILLKVEQLAKASGKEFRQQIYAYMEAKLNCPRAELLAKAERMHGQSEENRSRKLVQKLKKVVEAKMGKLLETYDAECRRVTEMKSTMHVIGFMSENQIPVQMPRRRFAWTETSRKLLVELLMVVKSNFDEGFVTSLPGKGKSGSVEAHLEDFLKQEVLPMWPTGWMAYESLAKEVERRMAWNQKQMIMKELVSNSAAAPAIDGGPVVAKKDSSSAERGRENGTAATMGGGVIITPVPKVSGGGGGENSSSNKANGGRESGSSLDAKQGSQRQPPPPKKNYDYSITSLIGPSSNSQSTAVAAEGSVSSLKVKSVATLNNTAAPTTSNTVIVSCTDEEDVEEVMVVEPKERRELDQRSGGSGNKPVNMSAAAAAVRAKRTSDSDSSCEIVNVYSSSSKAGGGGGAGESKPDLFRNGGGNSKDSSTGKKNPTPPAAPTPMETNDIDVNQIMQDLKEWQQWESSNFNAKKSEFAESRKDVMMLKKAKIMDQLSSLAQNHHAGLK